MNMTYADLWRPNENQSARLYDLALVLGGSILIALSAQVAFHIGPVPITGQTFGVLLVGFLLGWQRASAAVLAYLAEGLMGWPVFAGGTAGAVVLVGPTGGYLMSFVLAAGLVGFLAQRNWDRHIITTVLAMVAGNAIIYLFGVSWLKTLLALPWAEAIALGLTPFLIGDALKIALVALVLPLGWKLLEPRTKQD